MAITHEDVARMAALARLDIPPETQACFVRQFADIVAYMDVLHTVDTANVAPMYSPAAHEEVLREDVARPEATRILHNGHKGEYFVVPRIV